MSQKHITILGIAILYLLVSINGCKTINTGPANKPIPLAKNSYVFQVIDTHTHLSPDRTGNFYSGAQTALSIMKKLNIEKSIIMPYPFTPGQDGLFTIDDPSFMDAVKRNKGRLFFLGGGGSLNVMIQKAVSAGEVSLELKNQFEKRAIEILSKGAIGFGELAAEHVSMVSGHPYLSAPPDHELFLLLADIAADRGVPIDLHMEAVPDDMPLPEHLSSPPNPKTLAANIPGLKRLLAHNPKTTIIWAHVGWDNTGLRTIPLMAELLERHPNLYMSLKINRREKVKVGIISQEGKLRKEWVELLVRYPDRFIIGSDLKYGQPRLAKTGVIAILKQLPPDVARKVAYENAIRIFRLS